MACACATLPLAAAGIGWCALLGPCSCATACLSFISALLGLDAAGDRHASASSRYKDLVLDVERRLEERGACQLGLLLAQVSERAEAILKSAPSPWRCFPESEEDHGIRWVDAEDRGEDSV